MKKKIRHYIYAGLDFLFDEEGKHYFIEANSAPGIHGRMNVLKELARFMGRQKGGDPCVMTSLRFKGHKGYPKRWVSDTLKKMLPDLRLCYEEKNIGKKETLIDAKGREFVPSCVLKNEGRVPIFFENRIPIINSRTVTTITKDKILTYDIVIKHIPNLRVPKTFIVDDTSEAVSILKENAPFFGNGFVLKPVDEALGRGVRVFDSPNIKFKIRHRMILQQRIIPELRDGRYWDLRVHAVNGKVVGGVIRESKRNVTNTARGGRAVPAPPRIIKDIKSLSERIVDIIERESKKIKVSF